MKKMFAILLLFLILVAVCTFEEIYFHSFVAEFSQRSTVLSQSIKTNEDNLNVYETKQNYSSLKKYWDESKKRICFLANYEKIKSMDESFIKLNVALETNDKALAYENSAIIENCKEFFNYIIGFNINNLF